MESTCIIQSISRLFLLRGNYFPPIRVFDCLSLAPLRTIAVASQMFGLHDRDRRHAQSVLRIRFRLFRTPFVGIVTGQKASDNSWPIVRLG